MTHSMPSAKSRSRRSKANLNRPFVAVELDPPYQSVRSLLKKTKAVGLMHQVLEALNAHQHANNRHQSSAGVWHFCGELMEPCKTLGGMLDRQGSERAHRYQRDGQAEAERQHQGKTQREAF